MEELTDSSGIDSVARALARLDAQGQIPGFGECLGEKVFAAASLYTVFISAHRQEDYLEVLRRFSRERGDGFVWLCPIGSEEEELTGWELAGQTIYVQEG